MNLRAGSRWRSVVCTTEVVVVRSPVNVDVAMRCGGSDMVPVTQSIETLGPINPDFAAGTAVGKRYTEEMSQIELLCTKSGKGTLSIGETLLSLKAAKALPSSD
jgi:hypothetical protein